MKIEIFDTEAAAVARVCEKFHNTLARKPETVLGLATGGTMEPVYARLRDNYQAGEISFANATSFNLDEYIGLEPTHPCSYRHYMREHLFNHVNFATNATFLPHGDAEDPDKAAAEYEALIGEKGPIDLQLLGLGGNGHIGFNEPSSSLGSRTRTKSLTRETREANMRYFNSFDETPREAITMGIQTIMDAREIVLLALGAKKARAAHAAFEGPVSAFCPASVLQFHPKCTIILDKAAAAKLEYIPYYALT